MATHSQGLKMRTSSQSGNTVYIAWLNSSDLDSRGRMEIDRGLAPWAMVDHVTTHGDRGTTTAPEAKSW